jgi:perosamine synthetase
MKKIFFGGPLINKSEINSVINSVKEGFYDKSKEDLNNFADKIKKLLKINYVHLTFTCTHAMHLALMACGVKKGDEVILPDMSWVATAQAISYTGAKCIFVDINPKTLCIDPEKIIKAITKKTKAVMVVHSFGHPCEMNSIIKICKEFNLKLIEDAAPAMGSHIQGKFAGTFGDVGCFSFQGSKIITSNEGGAFVTNSNKKFEFAKLFSILGRTNSKADFWSDFIGYRYGMSNLNASLGNAQISKLQKLISIKRKIASEYINFFYNNKMIEFIKEPEYGYSNYSYPNIFIKKSNKIKRNKLIKYLNHKKIQSRAMFPLTSEMPMFKKRFYNKESKIMSENCLTLPSYPYMTHNDIKRVSMEIINFLKDY